MQPHLKGSATDSGSLVALNRWHRARLGQHLTLAYTSFRKHVCCLQKTHLRTKDIQKLKEKGWIKIFYASEHKKKKVAIIISDKTVFRTKAITRDKESHYIILKEVVKQEDITLVNIGAPKYIKTILEGFKKEFNSNTVIVRGFNT